MSSVNFELMQSLLQVTPQSKTFESASTTSDSSVSFKNILEDMNEKGITLSKEEAAICKEALEENNVDLEELHKALSSLKQLENVESNEDTEEKSLLDVLLESLEVTEEMPVDLNEEATMELVQEQVATTLLAETVVLTDTEDHTKETEEVKIEVESVKPTVAATTEMASVNSSTNSIDTKHETLKSENKVNETFNTTLNETLATKNAYVAKPVYHEVNFDTNENVIISDNSVLKLDLMYKGMFEDSELNATVNLDREITIEEPLLTAENVEVVSNDEVADFEKAYMTLNTIRPMTQSLSVDTNPEYRTEDVNANKLVANEFQWETPTQVHLLSKTCCDLLSNINLTRCFPLEFVCN